MAEQAINTVYLLGEQPDALCSDLIKSFTRKVFVTKNSGGDEHQSGERSRPGSVTGTPPRARSVLSQAAGPQAGDDLGNAFQLSQLIFIVGHVAFKHIVYLELVERELKRRKDVNSKGRRDSLLLGCMDSNDILPSLEKRQENDLNKSAHAKDVEELEQVAGSAEDDTADRITRFCDDEMLYGDTSLLAIFGPMIVHICGTPKKYKVSPAGPFDMYTTLSPLLSEQNTTDSGNTIPMQAYVCQHTFL